MDYIDRTTVKKALTLWRRIVTVLPVQPRSALLDIESNDVGSELTDSISTFIKELKERCESGEHPLLKIGIEKIETDVRGMATLDDSYNTMLSLNTIRSALSELANKYAMVIYLIERFGSELNGYWSDIPLHDDCIKEITEISCDKRDYPPFLQSVVDLVSNSLPSPTVESREVDMLNSTDMII